MDIEAAIDERLSSCLLTREMLTPSELAALRDEVTRELNGTIILDSILTTIPIYERILKGAPKEN